MKIQIKVGVDEIEVYFKIHIVTYFFINMKCDEFIQLKYSPPPSIYKDLWLPRWREGLKSRLTCAGELQGWTPSPWLACRTWRWGDIGAGRFSFGTSRTPQLVSRRCRMSFLQVKKNHPLNAQSLLPFSLSYFSFTFSLDKLLEKAIAVLFAEMNFFSYIIK